MHTYIYTCRRFYIRGIINNITEPSVPPPTAPAWEISLPPNTLEDALNLLISSGFLKKKDLSAETQALLSSIPFNAAVGVLEKLMDECLHSQVQSKWYDIYIHTHTHINMYCTPMHTRTCMYWRNRDVKDDEKKDKQRRKETAGANKSRY